MKKILRKIFKHIIEIFPKQNKILCGIEYYENKKIIKMTNNVYIFSKFLLKNKEKVFYFNINKIKVTDIFNIITSKIIIHKTYPYNDLFSNKNQKNIILGYFTPFKGDRYLEKFLDKYGENYLEKLEKINQEILKNDKNFKYITSSKFASKLIAKANNLPINNFIEIGMSRNNIEGISLEKLKKIFNIKGKVNKIILYTPTFRDKYIYDFKKYKFFLNYNDNNIFGYENIDKEISELLEKNNVYIIIKLHKFFPYYEEKERKILSGEIKLPKNCLIFSSDLEDKYNIGIYNLFDVSDAMIADYSSISFDYLLKDKPIFYNIFDIDEYREYRGFSYEPIEELMAGELIRNEKEFLNILKKFSKDYEDKYKEKRQKVNLLVNGTEKQEDINEKIYSFIKEFTNE